jgi:4-hydroxy-tetrahydrodipicolinate synthase
MTRPELVVAPLTPFTSDLNIDAAALKREIDYVVADCGATMVVAAGVEAQEYTYLGLAERKELIRLTLECVAGRCPVMVGISHPSFRTAIELAHFAHGLERRQCRCSRPCGPSAGRRPSAIWWPISKRWRAKRRCR